MNSTVLQNFKTYYSILNEADPGLLDEIYDPNVIFKDPLHEIRGLEALKKYFDKLNANLIQGSTSFEREVQDGNFLSLEWQMDLQLKRPKKTITASGVSILKIHDKVVSQRDYFDAGEFFYEHIPLVGKVIGLVKRKLG